MNFTTFLLITIFTVLITLISGQNDNHFDQLQKLHIRITRSWEVAVKPEDFDNTIDITQEQRQTLISDGLSSFTILCLIIGAICTVIVVLLCTCCCYLWKLFNLSRFLTISDVLRLIWNSVIRPCNCLRTLQDTVEATLHSAGLATDNLELNLRSNERDSRSSAGV